MGTHGRARSSPTSRRRRHRAMKCATTALHAYLDAHPDIANWPGKEANFFTGGESPTGEPEDSWRHGQWHRGVDWYTSLFDQTAKLRGESSPGYRAPDNPLAAERMAEVVPDARLVYLVRARSSGLCRSTPNRGTVTSSARPMRRCWIRTASTLREAATTSACGVPQPFRPGPARRRTGAAPRPAEDGAAPHLRARRGGPRLVGRLARTRVARRRQQRSHSRRRGQRRTRARRRRCRATARTDSR